MAATAAQDGYTVTNAVISGDVSSQFFAAHSGSFLGFLLAVFVGISIGALIKYNMK